MLENHPILLAARSEAPQESPTPAFKSSHPELEDLLAEVNALAHRLNQVGRSNGAGRLAFAAHQVLQALERGGPQSVPSLARLRSSSRQNLQVIVDRLVKQGCVSAALNPSHKSSPLFHLTTTGRATLEAGNAWYSDLLEDLAANGSGGGFREAAEVMRRLRLSIPSRTTRTGTTSPGRPERGPESQSRGAVETALASAPAPSPEAEEELPVSLL